MELRRADVNGWGYSTRTSGRAPSFPVAREDMSLGLRGGEALRLAAAGPCRAANQYADLALVDHDGEGLPMSRMNPGDGDILCAYCPKSGILIPGRMMQDKHRHGLELARPAPKGERAFVLDEGLGSLVTASLPSDGGDKLRILPRVAIMSWLLSCASRAAEEAKEYDVEPSGEFFVLRRRGGGPVLRGRFKGAANEMDDISWKVATVGLGGIIDGYDLEEER